MTNVAQYNADAVQAAIDQDKTISKKQGQLIHALLKGRTRPEPKPEVHSCGACDEYRKDYADAIADGRAPDYGPMLDIKAVAGSYGTAILARFSGGRYLSPYFSQNDSEGDCWGNVGGECQAPGECEFGWCGSDRYAVQQDAHEWLSTMSGCGIFGEWDWVPSGPACV